MRVMVILPSNMGDFVSWNDQRKLRVRWGTVAAQFNLFLNRGYIRPVHQLFMTILTLHPFESRNFNSPFFFSFDSDCTMYGILAEHGMFPLNSLESNSLGEYIDPVVRY